VNWSSAASLCNGILGIVCELIERPKLGALRHGFRKHTSPSIKWIWRNLSETAPVAPAAEPSSLLYYTSELALLFLIFFADSLFSAAIAQRHVGGRRSPPKRYCIVNNVRR
jgi:hypothetical protein